jgi:hypothetical protein
MTKIWRVLIALVLILPLALPAFADIEEARAVLQRALTKLQEFGDYRLPDGGRGNAWWAWNMNPGYYNQVDRTFYRGNTYALVAGGDSRVRDVDIKVYDENWRLIASDEDSSAIAVVQFTPRWTGPFHVRTIYYRGEIVGSVGFFIGYRQ